MDKDKQINRLSDLNDALIGVLGEPKIRELNAEIERLKAEIEIVNANNRSLRSEARLYISQAREAGATTDGLKAENERLARKCDAQLADNERLDLQLWTSRKDYASLTSQNRLYISQAREADEAAKRFMEERDKARYTAKRFMEERDKAVAERDEAQKLCEVMWCRSYGP